MTDNAEFETVLYEVAGKIATITLNRPEQLNTIVPPMPAEVQAAVHRAVRDPAVSVIVVRGAGRSFCAGYNFGGGFHHWDDQLTSDGKWDPGKDFMFATADALSPREPDHPMFGAARNPFVCHEAGSDPFVPSPAARGPRRENRSDPWKEATRDHHAGCAPLAELG